MKYCLDTCVISDFVKGHQNVQAILKRHKPHELAISTITLMEIEYGLALNLQRKKKIQPIITALLDKISLIPYQQQAAETTAQIRAQLKQQGKPIGPYDIMIAGVALSQNLTLVTSNTKEFERIIGLKLENWRN